jgi:hypothetical protein
MNESFSSCLYRLDIRSRWHVWGNLTVQEVGGNIQSSSARVSRWPCLIELGRGAKLPASRRIRGFVYKACFGYDPGVDATGRCLDLLVCVSSFVAKVTRGEDCGRLGPRARYKTTALSEQKTKPGIKFLIETLIGQH